MTPEKWQKVKNLFATVQEIPVNRREAYLFDECGGDDEISGEVIRLLDSYSEDDGFLENSAVAEVASMFEEEGNGIDRSGDADASRFAPDTLVDGRYEIVRMLGKGGMGEVYLANDKNLDRKVALKVLPSELTESKSRLQRFEQEARAVSALNHPHILTIFEFGESGDGDHYIASEYVEGKTLNELSASGHLGLNKILDITMQVTSALSAAHQAGITHRDIKPDNIMVRHDGYIKVLDFGLAKLTEPEHERSTDSEAATKALIDTAPGSVMGTAAYMSPEQARGLDVDARTDIWSLGVVIYEMLTGHQPFKGGTSTDTIIAVIKKDPVPLSSYVSDLPSEIEWVVAKTLSKEIDGRYQTAKELNADIAKIKKQVEFIDERERTSQPSRDKDGNPEAPTTLFDDAATKFKEAETTRELTDGKGHSEESRHESSLEYAVAGAQRYKALSVFIALILVATISVAVYYAFFAVGSGGSIDSIAVLPFENGSDDPNLVYLSDGISENLIDRLSQLPQLKVIARSSSWKFRGNDLDIQDVAKQLGVRVIVMGKVVQVGEKLSIRIEVVDAQENKALWSQQFERTAGDIFAIQNEIARTVSAKLQLKLTPDQKQRLSVTGTTNMDAYQNYLNGLVELRGADDTQGKALDYFLKAVELDPNFAEAYAQLSILYTRRTDHSDDPDVFIPKAKAAAQKALELDDKLSTAYVALALTQEFEYDWAGAEESYQRAIGLNPNTDNARNWYAFFLAIMGRKSEALEQNEQARLRDPANRRLSLVFEAAILTQSKDFDKAIKALELAQTIDGTGSSLNFDLGYAYAGKGMYDRAREEFEKYKDIKKFTQSHLYLAATYAKIPEKRAEAFAIAKNLETGHEYVSPALMAALYSALGENDKALDSLEKAYEQKDVLLRYIGVGYEYDSLRGNPRFKALLGKMNLNTS